MPSRSPHGERGLKSLTQHAAIAHLRRSPHGERGLKFNIKSGVVNPVKSLSSWRAWIEIQLGHGKCLAAYRVALLMESVD